MKNIAFYLGIGTLFTHELDAMPNHEWRVLPLLSSLSDAVGEMAFVIAHVPLFFVVIAFVASLDRRVRRRARQIASAFLIVHAALHFAFSGADAYEFSSWLSVTLVYGAAVCGLGYFLAQYLDNQRAADGQ